VSYITSEIKRDIARNRDFFTPRAFAPPPLEGPRRNIAITFDVEKLELCVYPKVKKFDDMLSHFDEIQRVTDGQTDILQ